MAELKEVCRQDQILIIIARMSISPSPDSYVEYGHNIWDVFHLGKEWQALETSQQKDAADETRLCGRCGFRVYL